ncbi:hypothetical protein [Zophobihabitans entericus]|uniref:GRAM domain-containing protein n=1 Tax=Zophobihabitans entericus TaxID=1635327 RepID=A0A6G9IBZ1_9GAMM|nr:hypothetical protein [Zophobihabitans entericus]QIQ21352.1 hypothetical protein IPMB12_06400 [Zophobihabitans entericus]
MKRKNYKCVSRINLSTDGRVLFEQKVGFADYLKFGLPALFFKKKNPQICRVEDVVVIETSSTMLTGNLIVIYTQDCKYVLVARDKTTWQDIVIFLQNSTLQSKLDMQ